MSPQAYEETYPSLSFSRRASKVCTPNRKELIMFRKNVASFLDIVCTTRKKLIVLS